MTKKKRLAESIETETIAGKTLQQKVEKTRVRKKSYTMDLRIHSPSSLGYLGIQGIDTAPALVRLAKVKGLDVIAVTDFYSAEFIDRITEAAKDSKVTVLPGVAIRTAIEVCDDVVLTCLFPEDSSAETINRFLQRLEVPASKAGDENFIVPLPFAKILEEIDKANAVVIPSRMDKTPHRKAAIPALVEQYGFRAFDLAYFPESAAIFEARWPKEKFQLLSFSNANALAQVGSRISKVKMAKPGFLGLRDVVERV
ncbi:MAG: PHP domain-containing protein [Bdellovibrionales bacterium]|nr:PHP domain-containing protein [Bdellovibrionales bacterium]